MTFPQSGMTLVEVLVTISLLSLVMATTLTLYSRIMKTNRQRDSVTSMIADADRILATLEQDVRNADSVNSNFTLDDSYTVVAALSRTPNGSQQPTVVYAFGAEQPHRLFRVSITDAATTATELSPRVQSLTISSSSAGPLVDVELVVEENVDGELRTWKASSAFTTQAL
jgi:prepilin-type N-terminal cleavage/methylation domain-containing protein